MSNQWVSMIIFFANLKNEVIYHKDFKTKSEARSAIFDYIELFYNRKRLHQTLNYTSPDEYERTCQINGCL
ncbi:MAG: IS3 family transposase [Gammaproteobacteria bacterium]|nr:IS3 family transposase [Gammaproteobacteria bacterium]